MKTFEHFPREKICPLCDTSVDRPCILVPIDGTNEGNICEFIPVHVDCLTKGDLRYNREANVFYKVVKK